MSIISCTILFYNKKTPVLQKPRKQAFLLFIKFSSGSFSGFSLSVRKIHILLSSFRIADPEVSVFPYEETLCRRLPPLLHLQNIPAAVHTHL